MLISGHRTLLIKCHHCGRLREYDINLFNISENRSTNFSCKCGKENISIKKKNKKTYLIEILCFGCGQKHLYKYSLKDLISKNLTFNCIDEIEICFIGDHDVADEIINDYDLKFGKMFLDLGFDDYFKNSQVFAACLNKIDRLRDNGKISCDCQNENINIEIFPDRVEIKCLGCGSVQIVYAETEEDLDVLSKKKRIILHEHSISYIDSIVEKNKNIKQK